MSIVTINGTDIASYNAELIDFSISQNDISDNYYAPSFSAKPIPLKGNIGSKTIELLMDFHDGTGIENNAFHKVSDLIGYLMSCNASGNYIEIDVGDGFGYTCCFESATDPVEKAPWIKQCSVSFVGFRHRTKITKTTTSHYLTISNQPRCDLPSPIKVKYTPPTGTTQFTVTVGGTGGSNTQNRIKCSNVSGYIVIDALNGTVKDSLGNAFHKTNMKEFPFFTGNSTLIFMSHNYAYSDYLDNGTAEIEVLPVCY